MNQIIDNRIELISIIHYLGEYKNIVPVVAEKESEYTELINNYFKNGRNYEAIKYSDYLAQEKAFNYDAPYNLILHYSLKNKLEKQANISEQIHERIQKREADYFIALLNEFIIETDFFDFIEKAQKIYSELTNKYYSNSPGCNYKNILDDYYGYKKPLNNLFFAPLNSGSYGSKIDDPFNLYSIVGLDNELDMDDFQISWINIVTWHEFGHSYINEIEKKYMDEINSLNKLYDPISEKMVTEGNAYGYWSNCFNEHIVRAITNRLVLKYYGSERYKKYVNWDNSQGFIYIDILDDMLTDYEINRTNYKIIDEFYPKIIDRFLNLSEDDKTIIKNKVKGMAV